MPRRRPKDLQNNKPYSRQVYINPSKKKTRYGTKQQAERVKQELMTLNPDIELKVYQDIDLGWYLTSL